MVVAFALMRCFHPPCRLWFGHEPFTTCVVCVGFSASIYFRPAFGESAFQCGLLLRLVSSSSLWLFFLWEWDTFHHDTITGKAQEDSSMDYASEQQNICGLLHFLNVWYFVWVVQAHRLLNNNHLECEIL